MKLRAQLRISGFDINALTTDVRNTTKDVVFDSCMRIEANAKQNCKVDTGELRADIHIKFSSDGLFGSVGTNVAHGPFVEFGTGQRGAASNVIIPEDVDYTYGFKKGMAAQPFLFPALEQERPVFQQSMKGVFKK